MEADPRKVADAYNNSRATGALFWSELPEHEQERFAAFAAALRQTPASPPPVSGDEVERLLALWEPIFERHALVVIAGDFAYPEWRADLARAALAALSPPPPKEIGEPSPAAVASRLDRMAAEDEHWDNPDLAATHRQIARTIRDQADTILSLTEREARLREALERLTEHYVQLVNCGDCGNWDPEEEDVVIAARAALAREEQQAGGEG